MFLPPSILPSDPSYCSDKPTNAQTKSALKMSCAVQVGVVAAVVTMGEGGLGGGQGEVVVVREWGLW